MPRRCESLFVLFIVTCTYYARTTSSVFYFWHALKWGWSKQLFLLLVQFKYNVPLRPGKSCLVRPTKLYSFRGMQQFDMFACAWFWRGKVKPGTRMAALPSPWCPWNYRNLGIVAPYPMQACYAHAFDRQYGHIVRRKDAGCFETQILSAMCHGSRRQRALDCVKLFKVLVADKNEHGQNPSRLASFPYPFHWFLCVFVRFFPEQAPHS